LAYETVDHGCGSAFAYVELPCELAHCHRLPAEVGQYAQLVSGDGMELISQLSVQQSAEAPLHLRLKLAVAIYEDLTCRGLRRAGRPPFDCRDVDRAIVTTGGPVQMSSAMSHGARTVPLVNIPVGEIVGLLSRDRWSEHSLAGEPIPAREAYWTTLVEVAALWSASICCQRNTSRMILPSFSPLRTVRMRVHFLQPEHGLDGDANPPCRDQCRTWRSTRRAATALSSRGRARSVEPQCVPDDP